MTQSQFFKYTNSPEFRELLQQYEDSLNSGAVSYYEVDDLVDIAEYYHSFDRLEAAEEAINICLEQHPDEPLALLFSARMYLIDYNNKEKAREYIDKVPVEHRDNNIEYVYVNAELMMVEDGDAHRCETYIKKCYDKLYDRHGKSYLDGTRDPDLEVVENENEDENEDENRNYNDDDCSPVNFPLDIAMLYLDHDYHVLAEAWLKKSANPCVAQLEYWETWARLYQRTGRLPDAVTMWNKVLDIDAYNVNAWLQLCDCQFNLGDNEEALQSAEYAIAIDSNCPEAYMAKGSILYEMGKSDESFKVFQRCKELCPDDSQVYLFLAAIYIDKGDAHTAMNMYKEAIEKSSYDPVVMGRIGVCLYEFNLFESASAFLHTLMKPYEEADDFSEAPVGVLPYLAALGKIQGKKDEEEKYSALTIKYCGQDALERVFRRIVSDSDNKQEV